jgi:hypothetical protein
MAFLHIVYDDDHNNNNRNNNKSDIHKYMSIIVNVFKIIVIGIAAINTYNTEDVLRYAK